MSGGQHIRFCSFVSAGILDIENEEDSSSRPIMSGGLGDHVNLFVEYFTHGMPPFNRSLIAEGEFGTRNQDGSFTGCAGRLQKNESDVVIGFVQYPLDDYYRVYPFQILAEGRVMMISTYNVVDGFVQSDLLDDSTRLISPSTYIAAGCCLIALAILFKVFTVVRKTQLVRKEKRTRIIYEFLSTFAHQSSDFIDSYNPSRRLMLLMVTILSFFLLLLFSNLISTESVVAKKAEVINNYEDFLKRPKLTPTFVTMFSDHHEFRYAKPGTNAYKIWKRINPKDIDQHIFADPNTGAAIKIGMSVRAGTSVFFINSFAAEFCINSMLRLRSYMEGEQEHSETSRMRVWRSFDPEALIRQMGIAMRTPFRETVLGKITIRRMRQAFEIGLVDLFKRRVDKGMMPHLRDPSGMAEIASRTVVVQQVDNDCQTKVGNIRHLLTIYGWTALAAFTVMIIEVIWRCFVQFIHDKSHNS